MGVKLGRSGLIGVDRDRLVSIWVDGAQWGSMGVYRGGRGSI